MNSYTVNFESDRGMIVVESEYEPFPNEEWDVTYKWLNGKLLQGDDDLTEEEYGLALAKLRSLFS